MTINATVLGGFVSKHLILISAEGGWEGHGDVFEDENPIPNN